MHFLLAADDINPLGHVVDRSLLEFELGGQHHAITLHMVTLVAAALLGLLVMIAVAKKIATGPASDGNERYITKGRLAQLIEVIILYMRDEVIKPVLGPATDRYLPYLLTVFAFVLANNLLGLVPLLDLQHLVGSFFGDSHFAWIGGTATGNLAVTGGLALIAFIVIQVHGLRELGVKGWAHHLLGGAPWWLFPIMVPVEIMSMLIKPGALAIRLFANMLAGHTLLATLMLFGVMAKNGMGSAIAGGGITVVAALFAVAISFLELFVAFLQAFIFMFLVAVFIGQLSHHHDHDDEHEHAHA